MWTFVSVKTNTLKMGPAINVYLATRTASLSSYKHCLLLHSRLASRVAKHDTILLIPCKILPVAFAQVKCDDWLSILPHSGVCDDWLSLLLQTDVNIALQVCCCCAVCGCRTGSTLPSVEMSQMDLCGAGELWISKCGCPWLIRSSLE
jgi:hypothetical protein